MSPGKRVRMAEVVRRQRTRRLDAVTVLAFILPLVTIGVLALVRQPPVHDQRQPPTLTQLTNATVVCPSAAPRASDGWVSTAGGQSGAVSLGSGPTVPVSPHRATRLPGSDATVVEGRDALAPGLLALRSGTAPLSAEDCGTPMSDQWFTGLGAGAAHDSVIELVNPDSGPADADITLYGGRPFTARKLHGITIPAHKTIHLDLGAIVPRRVLLSAQVQVTRGRLGVHVLDSRTDLVHHRVRREWVPRQLVPATDNELLGLPTGRGPRTLQLVNPGADVVRAEIKVVTGDTSFTPKGLDTVSIPAGTTKAVSLTAVLGKALADGAVGVQVTSDGPVAASVLTDLGTDLALTVPDTDITTGAATLLPVGGTVSPMLYVTADSAGAAVVTAYDASGGKLLGKRVAEQQGHTVAVRLPRGTAYVSVRPQNTVVRAAAVLRGDGATVLPLHELLTRGLVPQIQPGSS